MKKVVVFFFLLCVSFSIIDNCTCENYSYCLDKYNNALFYKNYSDIVCYGRIILNKYNNSIYKYDIDLIKKSISYALDKLNKTNLSKKFLKESGFIIEYKKQTYFEHITNKKKENTKNNDNLMLMLIFLLIIILCLYLLYLEKNKGCQNERL